MYYLLETVSSTAIISGAATLLVALVGIFGNLYLANVNKKRELLIKEKETEQKEYQFLLENLKSFWQYQNGLYSETLKIASVLVLNEDIKSAEFLSAYNRFWELYWSELPTCESKEITSAMAAIKDKVYDKKHLDEKDEVTIKAIKHEMKSLLLDLALAVKKSSLLLEYSEKLRTKFRSGK